MIYKKNINICVFCGSSKGNNDNYTKESEKLGFNISKNGWNLVFGGGKHGLMGAVACGIDRSRSEIISVVPKALNKKKNLFDNVTRKILVKNLFMRKQKMLSLSDIIFVLPGGFGTLDELLEIIALNYLDLKSKKVIILNIQQYWDPLKKLILNMKKNQFIKDTHKTHIHFFNSLDKAIKFAKKNL